MCGKLPTNATKDEEFQFLGKFADKLEDGTYLNSLFTGAMMSWVQQQIHNDFMPDLFAHYEAAKKDAMEAQGAVRREAEKLNQAYADAKAAREMIQAELRHRTGEVQALERRMAEMQKYCDGLEKDVQDARCFGATVEADNSKMTGELRFQRELNVDLSSQVEFYTKETYRLQGRIHDLEEVKAGAETLAAERGQAILELKAELYDLMTARK